MYAKAVACDDSDKNYMEIAGKIKKDGTCIDPLNTVRHRLTLTLDGDNNQEIQVIGTSAELFDMCKQIVSSIYKDHPLQKAVAKASLMDI